MNYDDEPLIYILLLIIILIIVWVVVWYIFPPKVAYTADVGLWEAVLEPAVPPYFPYVYTNGLLIEDLIECESNGNPEALGDEGRAKGILQFHEPTFKMYCVDKYGLIDDIWDPQIQKECADRMLKSGLEYHWSCYSKVI